MSQDFLPSLTLIVVLFSSLTMTICFHLVFSHNQEQFDSKCRRSNAQTTLRSTQTERVRSRDVRHSESAFRFFRRKHSVERSIAQIIDRTTSEIHSTRRENRTGEEFGSRWFRSGRFDSVRRQTLRSQTRANRQIRSATKHSRRRHQTDGYRPNASECPASLFHQSSIARSRHRLLYERSARRVRRLGDGRLHVARRSQLGLPIGRCTQFSTRQSNQ